MTSAAPTSTAAPEVRAVSSLEEASQVLAELGPDGAALAGGTWIMRRPLRSEPWHRVYVPVAGLPGLRELDVRPTSSQAQLGAGLTHTELVAELADGTSVPAALAGLAAAARLSAFPQVRNVATLGGNIAAARVGFRQADLVPALLAAGARLQLGYPDGRADRPVADFLGEAGRPAGEILAGVAVPTPPDRFAGFGRLTVRGAGEYAVVNVAVSVDVDPDGTVRSARVAVGALEPVPRLIPEAAAVLVGRPLDGTSAREAGSAAAAAVDARDDRLAPGWYRRAVLPALLERACAQATSTTGPAWTATDEGEPR
ncbi:FAD binding domain-containing protein [Pseudonocardia kujensis]|uniref:FAD binding domain-containing protein n=1 Tax=Pseudonocardia kujensis TaxID=1128675 RepID=UPI001E62F410|nr:FAD binding domain-containing protein [Pseudonocardia kujensis]MCE0762455.1 FAD binding domain-containing protein [Pseudonocardia kujensis]